MLQIESEIHRYGQWIALFIVLMIGLSVALYLYNVDKYSLIYFGDSVSHMVGARKLVDWSENPGLAQLGTVWLPLPHFLLLPFTLIDPLFATGFAGLVVSLPSLAITSALLYKMVKAHLPSSLPYIGFIAAFLYASNPNIIYMGITAMTEAPFMLFFVASAYYLQKWIRSPEKPTNLVLCSAFISLATLCRYEGWILPLFLIPYASVVLIQLWKRDRIQKIKLATNLLLSIASISGVVIWLAYNAVLYGDPLEFANADYYSAASQATNRPIREMLFLQPANVFTVYGITTLVIYGPILMVTAAIGYVIHRRFEESNKREVLYGFLALPPIFTIISLLIGIGEMTFWFNSRFLILLAPLVIMLAMLFLNNLFQKSRERRTVILMAAVAGLFASQLVPSTLGVPTYLDAKGGFDYKVNPFAVEAGEALGSMYDNGMIMMLTGSAQGHRIMVTSGIPLKQFDDIIESSTWKKSYYEPWSYDKWIVMSKEPDSDAVEPVNYWEERESVLSQYYKPVFENEYFVILTLKN